MNISFIIPCYNCEATLEDAVSSVYEDNFSPGDEVILVDDCSTDTTPGLIEKLKIKYPGIIVSKHNINKGSAAASRNTAIDIASHELLFCLDSDNMLMPGTVSILKQFLLENNLAAAAFGEIWYFKKTKNASFMLALVFHLKITSYSAWAGDIWSWWIVLNAIS